MEILMLIVAVVLGPALGYGVFTYLNAKSPRKASPSDLSDDSSDQVSQDAPEEEVSVSSAKPSHKGASHPAPELESKLEETNARTQALLLEAKAKAKEIILEARDQGLRVKQEAEAEAEKVRSSFLSREKDVSIKEAELKVKGEEIQNKTEQLNTQSQELREKLEKADEIVRKKQEKLEKVANLTKEEARKELLSLYDKELAEEKSKKIREIEEEIKKNKDRLSQEILIDAMRFGATDYVVQHTTSRVKLPEEDMKGRIIGKEGRNIKAFEEVTGVELDLDSSPGEIIISSFDPIRREIAKVALERLLADGRIQPAKIEEVVEQTKTEIDRIIYKEGDNLCHRVGVYDIPEDLVKMLGKFKYRFSYGQNMIEHTLEETRIGVAIAHELNANVETVKLGCLFHDIGKIVNDEEGTHVQLGVDLLKKYKIAENVVNAVAEHHEDKPFSSIESAIVALADHISGARPGARSEDYETYVERLKNLEEAALAFDGVERVYALSAGREVRVYVNPSRVDDDSTALLAREIAKKIELEQTYPGVVKVLVIRETRVSETAK